MEDESLKFAREIGVKTTLHHAVQLMMPASILACINGREAVSKEDVVEINELFFDAKASAKLLAEQEDKYMK